MEEEGATKDRIRLPFEEEKPWAALERIFAEHEPRNHEDFYRFIVALRNRHGGAEEAVPLPQRERRAKERMETKIRAFFNAHLHVNMSEEKQTRFFSETLLYLKQRVLEMPALFPDGSSLRILRKAGNMVRLSRRQIASLMAGCFLCVFDGHASYDSAWDGMFNDFSYSNCFRNVEWAPLQHIIAYFSTLMEFDDAAPVWQEHVTFERVFFQSGDEDNPFNSDAPICNVTVMDTETKIEDVSQSRLHMDFANNFIGGGAIDGGNLQEEILFNTRPELIVALLLSPVLQEGEGLIMCGSKKFSSYAGYGSSWECVPLDDGPLDPATEHVILAVDAKKTSHRAQGYEVAEFLREFDKASSVFRTPHHVHDAIVTGFWGCGSFGGDRDLKTLIQILAASMAGRNLIFCPYHDADFVPRLSRFLQWAAEKKLRVKDVMLAHVKYSQTMPFDDKGCKYLTYFIENWT